MGRKKKRYYTMIKKTSKSFWLAMFLFIMVPLSTIIYGDMVHNSLISYFGVFQFVGLFMVGAFINNAPYTMKRKYLDNIKVSYPRKKKVKKK